jgi:uncharacterized protein (TIGR02217 family)
MATTITVYKDVILTNAVISVHAEGQNIRFNKRLQLETGVENVNQIWNNTVRSFKLGIKPMLIEQWAEVEAIHEVTEGGAYGFLLEDPKDHSVLTGVMTEISTGLYQLYKRITHTASNRHKDRKITRPRATGFTPYTNGTPIGTYTLDEDTGRITIPSNPTASTLTWVGDFYVPVHFMEDTIDWELASGGSDDRRLLAGPSVGVMEILE